MRIQMDMTERDRRLLYRLGLVVILAVFVLGSFRPLYRSLTEKNENIAAAEETKRVLDNKVMLLPGLEQSHAEADAAIAELQSHYYEPMNSAQIDDMLTTYMLSKGLMTKDMNIQFQSAPVAMEPYVNSQAAKDMAAGAATAANTENSEGGVVASDTTAARICGVTVSMKVTGSEASITNMLDDFDSLKPAARLLSCRWTDSGKTGVINDEGMLEFKETDTQQLELSVQLYMTGMPQ